MVNVAVIGSGYVGTVAAVAFAIAGNDVVGVEASAEKVAALRSGSVPFHEPGLEQHLAEQLATRRIRFTDDLAEGIAEADVVFICVGTPPGLDGRPDLTALRAATAQVGAAAQGRTIVVTKSTVPIGWGEEAQEILRRTNAGSDMSVVSNPEFLREGTAVSDFLYPDRVVIGGDADAVDTVAELYAPIINQSFPGGDPTCRPVLLRTDLATAETIKYAANAFLAAKITYINEVSRICDASGADVEIVADAVGLDHRIERKYLGAGIGYGGSCFGKDLEALTFYGVDHELDLPLINSVNPSNLRQRQHIIIKLRAALGGLFGRRIALLGLAYKPDTDDTRGAPSVTIARHLLEANADIVAYDPVVKQVDELPNLERATDVYEAVTDADATVLLTEWTEFGDIDFARVAELMRGDLVVDGRNWLDPHRIVAAGLRYHSMGRAPVTPPATD